MSGNTYRIINSIGNKRNMMETTQSIAVFGGTGMLGKPVVRELIKAGFAVTVVARNADKAKEVLPPQANVIEGNVENVAFLKQVLQGKDAVYISLNVDPGEKQEDFHPELDGIRNILEAAKAGQVKRVAYLSSLIKNYKGFDWWVFDIKNKAVETIKAAGIPYTIFYPTAFMETLTERQVQGSRINVAGMQKIRMYWIAGQDYGQQFAQSYKTMDGENKDFVVQGPEPLNTGEAAQTYADHYKHKKLKVGKAPLGLLKFLGWFSPQMKYAAKITEALNNNPETFQSQNTWDELGKPQTTMAQYASGVLIHS